MRNRGVAMGAEFKGKGVNVAYGPNSTSSFYDLGLAWVKLAARSQHVPHSDWWSRLGGKRLAVTRHRNS